MQNLSSKINPILSGMSLFCVLLIACGSGIIAEPIAEKQQTPDKRTGEQIVVSVEWCEQQVQFAVEETMNLFEVAENWQIVESPKSKKSDCPVVECPTCEECVCQVYEETKQDCVKNYVRCKEIARKARKDCRSECGPTTNTCYHDCQRAFREAYSDCEEIFRECKLLED